MVQLILEHFGGLKDPRVARTKRHALSNVLVMALCAVIAGADGWEGLAQFARSRAQWLASFLDMPHGVPCADTFRRVLCALHPQAFEACMRRWMQALAREVRGQVVAVDGKSVRGALSKTLAGSPLHLVHVWASEQRLLLAQQAVAGAPGEVAAIPELLAQLQLQGAVVTVDANGCTAKVAQAVVHAGADYVLHLKGNRGPLYSHVKDMFAPVRANPEASHSGVDTHSRSVSKGHGRREVRTAWAVALRPEDLPPSAHKWPRLRTAVLLRRERTLKGKVSQEWHYYLSSLPPQARKLTGLIRGHWGVENGLHWCLDVCMGEDSRTIRHFNGAQNFAVLSRIALTLLRREKTLKAGVPTRRKKAGWDTDYLLRVLLAGFPEN
ncbi:ISAs1 family transposase [Archangium minus]|uniref:ISAs1 family transposase n=1 Tax=Archangium minus TaxID=83450 RepID=UPI0037C06D3A